MFKLNNLILPDVGFGTYKINDFKIILSAIKNNYNYFDTASYYKNEDVLAEALSQNGLERGKFIIASKLWRDEMGYDNAKLAVQKSLENLKTSYIDIYFIHWPSLDDNLNIETWRALEEFYKLGKIRALGLSNFLPHHAEPLIKNILKRFGVMPSIAQLEFHPGYTQECALKYFNAKNILVQAWSPLGRGRIVNDNLILNLAAKYQASPQQICLKFALQKGVMPLVKSSSPERMTENLNLNNFNLTQEDMWRLETLPPLGWSGEHPDRERVIVKSL
ncbi:MAG: aldo/keto reductase [Synergistaceae bacterium]|nr:aldo/keto reductase [Synergistaceae bacterium]